MCLEVVLNRFAWVVAISALAAVAGPLDAQDARVAPAKVPATYTPPAGLCRVWLDDVPASQQPAPTDCASAIKNRPASAVILFGPKRRGEPRELESFTKRGGPPAARAFSPNALLAPRRKDARQATDSTVKPPVRKPEKPQ